MFVSVSQQNDEFDFTTNLVWCFLTFELYGWIKAVVGDIQDSVLAYAVWFYYNTDHLFCENDLQE